MSLLDALVYEWLISSGHGSASKKLRKSLGASKESLLVKVAECGSDLARACKMSILDALVYEWLISSGHGSASKKLRKSLGVSKESLLVKVAACGSDLVRATKAFCAAPSSRGLDAESDAGSSSDSDDSSDAPPAKPPAKKVAGEKRPRSTLPAPAPSAAKASKDDDEDDEDDDDDSSVGAGAGDDWQPAVPTSAPHRDAKSPREKNVPFTRVNVKEVEERGLNESAELADNRYLGHGGGWGSRANDILGKVKGKDFRHEKTKKKRGTYRGGTIDVGAVSSYKFTD